MKLIKWQDLKVKEDKTQIEDYIDDLKYNVEEIETSLDNDYVTHDQLQDEITTQIADMTILIPALVSFTLAGIMSIISIVAGSPVILKIIFFTLTLLSLFIIVLLLASIL